MIVGLDPCKPERRGPRSRKTEPPKLPVWAVEIGGRYTISVGHPPAGFFDLAVCEQPHPHGPAGKKSLISMGSWAGFELALTPARVRVMLPPQVWKDLLIPRFGEAKKHVFCANVKQLLKLPAQWSPKVDTDQDKIDACGIRAAADKLTPALIKKYEFRL